MVASFVKQKGALKRRGAVAAIGNRQRPIKSNRQALTTTWEVAEGLKVDVWNKLERKKEKARWVGASWANRKWKKLSLWSACNAGDPGLIPGWRRSPGEGRVGYPLQYSWASLVVKNPPAMWETWAPSLGWEDPLEKGTATHSSILPWRIPWTV